MIDVQLAQPGVWRDGAAVHGDLIANLGQGLAGGNCCGVRIFRDSGSGLPSQEHVRTWLNGDPHDLRGVAIHSGLVVVVTDQGIYVFDSNNAYAESFIPTPSNARSSRDRR